MMNMLAIFGLGPPEIIAIRVIVFLLSASKTEVRPYSELSQPIDVEVEKTADSKPEDK